MGISPSDIYIFGRSIGTGLACHLASIEKPGGVILMSAYTSIKKLVSELSSTFVGFFFNERFNNLELMKNVNSPCLLIHGYEDNLIRCTHSEILKNELVLYKKEVRYECIPGMSHNKFNL